MNTDQHGLKHSRITEKIIRAFFEVYNELARDSWSRSMLRHFRLHYERPDYQSPENWS
jgi:hypothetical protein